MSNNELHNALRPNVLIWRTEWLSYSETFVELQARNLERSRATYAGLSLDNRGRGLGATAVVSERKLLGGMQRLALSRVGWSPRLLRLIRENNVTLIHAHFGPDAITVAKFCQRHGIPLVVTLHGYDVSSMPLGSGRQAVSYRRRLRAVMAYAATVICVSEYVRGLAVNLGSPEATTVVHYVGVEIPQSVQRHSSVEGLVFVGRLVEKKGLDDLLNALGRLARGLRETPLTVIGDGPLRSEMEQLARSLKLNVEFKGALSHADVLRAIGAALALVMPSRQASGGDVEGLPTVIMEAMARGVPVVGTRHSGIPEAVRDGREGFLSEERDVDGLAANLQKLLVDRKRRDLLGNSARARAEELFDVSSQARILDDIYCHAAAASST